MCTHQRLLLWYRNLYNLNSLMENLLELNYSTYIMYILYKNTIFENLYAFKIKKRKSEQSLLRLILVET